MQYEPENTQISNYYLPQPATAPPMNGVVTNGANEVSGLQFTVDDPKKPQEDARNQAIADAKAKAEKLASELGVKLSRITNYSESGGSQPPILYGKAFADGVGGGGGPLPDIQVGQNEVRSYVSVTYEID